MALIISYRQHSPHPTHRIFLPAPSLAAGPDVVNLRCCAIDVLPLKQIKRKSQADLTLDTRLY